MRRATIGACQSVHRSTDLTEGKYSRDLLFQSVVVMRRNQLVKHSKFIE